MRWLDRLLQAMGTSLFGENMAPFFDNEPKMQAVPARVQDGETIRRQAAELRAR